MKDIFVQPKGNVQQIRVLAKKAISRYVGGMTGSIEESFRDMVENAMTSVGVQQASQKLSPEVIRSLYQESPLWTAYSRMEIDMVKRVNDIIAKDLINTNFINKYGQPAGFDRSKLEKHLREFTGISESRAELIARTEVAVTRNKGREIGYKIRNPEGTWKYKWGGPYDKRTSDTCKWIKRQVGPQGVSLDRLKAIVHEAQEKFHPNLTPRDWSAHPNCRHFQQKVVTRGEAS